MLFLFTSLWLLRYPKHVLFLHKKWANHAMTCFAGHSELWLLSKMTLHTDRCMPVIWIEMPKIAIVARSVIFYSLLFGKALATQDSAVSVD